MLAPLFRTKCCVFHRKKSYRQQSNSPAWHSSENEFIIRTNWRKKTNNMNKIYKLDGPGASRGAPLTYCDIFRIPWATIFLTRARVVCHSWGLKGAEIPGNVPRGLFISPVFLWSTSRVFWHRITWHPVFLVALLRNRVPLESFQEQFLSLSWFMPVQSETSKGIFKWGLNLWVRRAIIKPENGFYSSVFIPIERSGNFWSINYIYLKEICDIFLRHLGQGSHKAVPSRWVLLLVVYPHCVHFPVYVTSWHFVEHFNSVQEWRSLLLLEAPTVWNYKNEV